MLVVLLRDDAEIVGGHAAFGLLENRLSSLLAVRERRAAQLVGIAEEVRTGGCLESQIPAFFSSDASAAISVG